MVVIDFSSLGHMDDLINARPNNFIYISLILFHSFFLQKHNDNFNSVMNIHVYYK